MNSVVATIGAASEIANRSRSVARPERPIPDPDRGSRTRSRSLDSVVAPDIVDAPHAKPAAASRKSNGRAAASSKPGEDDARKQRSSPLVRRIARDNDVDISQIHGSGLGGRVTKHDILGYIETGPGNRDPGLRESRFGIRENRRAARSPEPGVPEPASRSSRSR